MSPRRRSGAPGCKRVLSRKTDHSVIERRRREKINDRLVFLQQTVPQCREKALDTLHRRSHDESRIASEMVLEKLCIITHAAEYIEELQAQIDAYKARGAGSPPPVERPACEHSPPGDSDTDSTSTSLDAPAETPAAATDDPHTRGPSSPPAAAPAPTHPPVHPHVHPPRVHAGRTLFVHASPPHVHSAAPWPRHYILPPLVQVHRTQAYRGPHRCIHGRMHVPLPAVTRVEASRGWRK